MHTPNTNTNIGKRHALTCAQDVHAFPADMSIGLRLLAPHYTHSPTRQHKAGPSARPRLGYHNNVRWTVCQELCQHAPGHRVSLVMFSPVAVTAPSKPPKNTSTDIVAARSAAKRGAAGSAPPSPACACLSAGTRLAGLAVCPLPRYQHAFCAHSAGPLLASMCCVQPAPARRPWLTRAALSYQWLCPHPRCSAGLRTQTPASTRSAHL